VLLCVLFFPLRVQRRALDRVSIVISMRPIQFLAVALIVLSTGVAARQNTSTPALIVKQAYEFLTSHLVEGTRCWTGPDGQPGCYPYHFFRPSLTKYSAAQWLWDSGSHMISWSHRNVTNSILDLRTMLQMQRANGFIPETTFWPPQSNDTNFNNELFYGNTETTEITQMPVLAHSLRAIYNQTKNISLLEEFVPKLVAYWRWWKDTRALSDSGLVSILHGWESGLDASPMYDDAYDVGVNPGFYEMYPHFVTLMASYNVLYHWNMSAILSRTQAVDIFNISYLDAWFYIEDVGLNSVYTAGWGILADLASTFNATLAAECAANEALFTERIVKGCWDEGLQRFVTRWRRRDGSWTTTKSETVQSILPLMIRHLPKTYVTKILHTQLLNQSKFWLPYPFPSTSADNPSFTPAEVVDLMWRGPTWGFTNWMVLEGLWVHNRTAELNVALNRWISLVEKSGIWEMYNPITGVSYGVEGLGMSCVIVDWIFRMGRVNSTSLM